MLVVKTLKLYIVEFFRRYKQVKMRKEINNTDFSLFCNNCVGGLFYHDLGLKFTVPTINLIIKPSQYIKFISNLNKYKDADLVQTFEYPHLSYPVGLLGGDIEIFFVHYKNFEDAKKKWFSRFQRINYDNVVFLLIEKDGCTKEDIIAFNNLPCKNKRIISHYDIPNLNNIWVVNKDRLKDEAEDMTKWEGMFGKRRYDDLNFVKWMNSLTPSPYMHSN